jgi:hypothetical protein
LLNVSNNNTVFPLIFAERLLAVRRVLTNQFGLRTRTSYIWEDKTKSVLELGRLAKDPFRIDQMPYLSQLAVSVKRTAATKGKKLHMYLSNRALTDKRGKFITQGAMCDQTFWTVCSHFRKSAESTIASHSRICIRENIS